jgi:hypothetical protein
MMTPDQTIGGKKIKEKFGNVIFLLYLCTKKTKHKEL